MKDSWYIQNFVQGIDWYASECILLMENLIDFRIVISQTYIPFRDWTVNYSVYEHNS